MYKKSVTITKNRDTYKKYFKRPIDCLLAVIAIIVLSPLLVFVAILVKVKLGAPILFKQKRVGKSENVFILYKFRTMTNETDEKGKLLPNNQRVVPFGEKLRCLSIDELPELFNVLIGDMSIVGPRPLLEKYLPYYTLEERSRHDVRPGLTGLAQITNGGNLKWDDKLAIDAKYSKNITFFGDIDIIFKTVKIIFFREDTIYDGYDSLDVERAEKKRETRDRE